MPFSPQTLQFLTENQFRDSKLWFDEHKPAYQSLVLEPLVELVRQLTPTMLQIDDQLVTEPRVDRTISRIRRDTRFSHDPSLYRDCMWIVFKRSRAHAAEAPGFYVEVSPRGVAYGCGFYQASTAWMQTMRRLILEGHASFAAAQQAFEAQTVFALEGDCYKRAHYPDQPETLRQWLERRAISFNAESKDFPLLYSDRFAEQIAADFTRLAPIYHFLWTVSAVQQQEEAGLAQQATFGAER